MKYKRLTKEQFEELHKEFINFLATQSITAAEWKTIKDNKPKLAAQELDLFSDLVWERVLSKVAYLENISPQHMYLFSVEDTQVRMIGLKVLDSNVDLTTKEGFSWLRSELLNDKVEIFNANKAYETGKNNTVFELIEQGSSITKGDLFKYFDDLVG
jgi:hypothetical protein